MNSITSAVTSPFRALTTITQSVGATVVLGSRMIFSRTRSWGVYLSRTRIDYRAEVGDPSTNSMVGATVGWLARNFPTAPVRIVLESNPDEFIPRGSTGPGFMLRLLEKPNDWYSGVTQWKATVLDFMFGNAYWLKIRAPGGRVVALWWVPRQFMEPAWPEGETGVFISHYVYTVDGVPYKVRPEDVVHFRNGVDPNNTRKGLSPLGSLFREIFTDDESSNFTASLLRNLGVPGVIISPSNTSPGARMDADKVKTSFMEKFGGDKRGEPLVMTAPADVKVLSWSPEQMNLRELRRIPEERTTAVLGVPAGVVGLGAGLDRNTFTNYGEAKKAAVEEGLGSMYRDIGATLENHLLPEFADTEATAYDVFFDIMVMPAFQEALLAIWKATESAATKGLVTRAQFLKAVGRKPAADGSDDVFIYPNNFIIKPVGEPERAPLTVVQAPAEEGAA